VRIGGQGIGVAEERGNQKAAVPAGSAAGVRVVARGVRLWLGLGAFLWALALAFLASPWTGPRSIVLGRLELSPAGAGIGAAVGILALWVCLKRFRDLLEWYKPGQGTAVRVTALGCLASLVLYGAYAFYQIPPTTSPWWQDLWTVEVFGKGLALKPILFPSAGIFVGVMAAAYLLLNRPRWADFLIETEGEIRKVSWPPKKEYVGSAVVVVVVVTVISFFLWGVDSLLSRVMQWVGIGF